MSNKDKICFRCSSVYPLKVKCKKISYMQSVAIKKLKQKSDKYKDKYGNVELPLKVFGEVDTVIETRTKFWGNTFFVIETENINLLPGVTSLGLGLIKIYKSKCFTIYSMKIDNTQKEETETNETKLYPPQKTVFRNKNAKIE